MAPTRRFLLVEDHAGWRTTFRTALLALDTAAHVEVAEDFDEAVHKLASFDFDVIIVDIMLPRSLAEGGFPEELGIELCRRVRVDARNRHAGLLVATAQPTHGRIREAFRDCRADDFIAKDPFTAEAFQAAVRVALRGAALRRAQADAEREVRLEIQVGDSQVTAVRVAGRSRVSYPCRTPLAIPAADWSARGDALNALLLNGLPDGWRKDARALGQALFEHLSTAPEVSAGLAAARAASSSSGELCLQLSGPAATIGVPFELMQDANGEYLVFLHRMIRSVTPGAGAVSKRTGGFASLIEAAAVGTPIRALVVGANADGMIPGAEEEARRIHAQLETELGHLGIRCEVTALIGPEATVANVSRVLASGGIHLFHYAGHGRFNSVFPEVSGLVLHGDKAPAILRASDLYLLCKDSALQVVFLSCCLGARSAAEAGSGDFLGVFDALAKANVPTVLGYRWVVGDDSALAMAAGFYAWLCRTLSPSEALFQARAGIAQGNLGWNDETWLSPILISQNP